MNYETLTALLRENRSYTEIAELLSVSRSTIKRYATQLRLSGFLDQEREPLPASEGSPCEVTFEDEPRRPAPGGVSLVELKENHCRFPIAYEEQHYFCGAERRDRKTCYCAEHHSAAWTKPPVRTTPRSKSGQ